MNIIHWILGFSAIIAIRMLVENLLEGLTDKSLDFFIGSTLAAYLFFLFSYLLILIFLSVFLKEKIKKLANVLLWGFFIVILPPILDKIFCGAEKCWSFYIFDSLSGLWHRFLVFFGSDPTIGITYGVRIEVALAVIFILFYIYLKTNRIIKSLTGALFTYIILFVLGSFPSWLTFIILSPSKKITEIQNFDVAGLFFSPASYFSIKDNDFMNALNVKMNLIYAFLIVLALVFFFWYNFREKFWLVVKNSRPVQLILHAGMIFIGAVIGLFYFPDNFNWNFFSLLALGNLIIAGMLAWLASVFLNDREDLKIDEITNTDRPMATGRMSLEDYRHLFAVGSLLSLVLALTVGVKFFLLILAYQILAWAYSAWPFRLKRFPAVASFVSALALVTLFLSGFILLADGQDISLLPSKVFWGLLIAFTFSLPVKDLKDIEGDKRNGVWTIPVILGEGWARFVIGLGIFFSYSLSVVLLNAKILFLPAMIIGAASFWIMQNKKIKPGKLHLWIFALLFIYTLIVMYLVFWPGIRFGLKFKV